MKKCKDRYCKMTEENCNRLKHLFAEFCCYHMYKMDLDNHCKICKQSWLNAISDLIH